MRISNYFKRAFTLIEVIIAMLIISIILSMTANFIPKIIETFKLKRAISYVQDNIDYLKLVANKEGTLGRYSLPEYLAHKKDVWGHPFYYITSEKLSSSTACVLKHTNLFVCLIKDYEAFKKELKKYNPSKGILFNCKAANGTLEEVTTVILSSGKNGNIQTPILKLDTDLEGDNYVVPVIKLIPPTEKVDFYRKVNENYTINDPNEEWVLATDPSKVADNDIFSKMLYDDIISYLPLNIAKAECPIKNIVGEIEKFEADPQKQKIGENVKFKWIATLSGNIEGSISCAVDFGDGNVNASLEGPEECLGYQDKVEHSYSSPGVYTPILKIFDDEGNLILTKTTTVYIYDPTKSECKVSSFLAYKFDNDNGKFTLIANASSSDATATLKLTENPVKFEWKVESTSTCTNKDGFISFGDGEYAYFKDITSINNVVHTYKSPGDFTAKVYCSCGCESNKINLSVYNIVEGALINGTINSTSSGEAIKILPPPLIDSFVVTPTYGNAPMEVSISYEVHSPNSTLSSTNVYLDGEKVPICSAKFSVPTKSYKTSCITVIKDPGFHIITLDVKDTNGNFASKFVIVNTIKNLFETSSSTSPTTITIAPPKGNFVVIKIQNPNNVPLYNYPIKIDALNLVDCLGTYMFEIVTQDGMKDVPYCFERENGECESTFCDPKEDLDCKDSFDKNFWTGNIWIKVPELPANSTINLIVYPKSGYYAKTGKEVFDLYENFKNDISLTWKKTDLYNDGVNLNYTLLKDDGIINITDKNDNDALVYYSTSFSKETTPYFEIVARCKLGSDKYNNEQCGITYFTGDKKSYVARYSNYDDYDDPTKGYVDISFFDKTKIYVHRVNFEENYKYHTLKLDYLNGTHIFYIDNNKQVETKDLNLTEGKIGILAGYNGYSIYDYIYVRKLAKYEPKYSYICYFNSTMETSSSTTFEGCVRKIPVYNLGNCDLYNYTYKLDISSIRECLSDITNTSQPSFEVCLDEECTKKLNYCFETDSGECKAEPINWKTQKYIWVRIPFLPANDYITLILKQVPKIEDKNNVDGSQVFDFYDDFDSKESLENWDIKRANDDFDNECFLDSENGLMYLTKAVNNRGCLLKLKKDPGYVDNYTIDFRFRISGGTGADGIGYFFNLKTSSDLLASTGWHLGLNTDSVDTGYLLELDTYKNTNDPTANYTAIAYAKYSYGSEAFDGYKVVNDTYKVVPNIADGKFHTISLKLINGKAYIFFDDNSTPILEYTLSDLTNVLKAIGASTGEKNNNHILDWIRIRKSACGLVTAGNITSRAKINLYYPKCEKEIDIFERSLVLINPQDFGFNFYHICADENNNGKCDEGEYIIPYCYYLTNGRCVNYIDKNWTGYIYLNVPKAYDSYTLIAEYDPSKKGLTDGTDWFKIGEAPIKGEEKIKVYHITTAKKYLEYPLSPDELKFLIFNNLRYKFSLYKQNIDGKMELIDSDLPYKLKLVLSTATSGDNVFLFYDGFNEKNINTTKWNIKNIRGACTENCLYIENSHLKIKCESSINPPQIYSNKDISTDNVVFEAKVDQVSDIRYIVPIYLTTYYPVPAEKWTSTGECMYTGNGEWTSIYIDTSNTRQGTYGPPYSSNSDILAIKYLNGKAYIGKYKDSSLTNMEFGFNGVISKISAGKLNVRYLIGSRAFHKPPVICSNIDSTYNQIDWVRARKIADGVFIEENTFNTTDSELKYLKVCSSKDIDNYQLNLSLKNINYPLYLVADSDTNLENGYIDSVNYCYEQSNGDCESSPITNKIWIKLPYISAGSCIYIYDIHSYSLNDILKFIPIEKLKVNLIIDVSGASSSDFYISKSLVPGNLLSYETVSDSDTYLIDKSKEVSAYVPKTIHLYQPIKIYISNIAKKDFGVFIKNSDGDIEGNAKYCFFHPENLECNLIPSNYVYIKMPTVVNPDEEKTAVFINTYKPLNLSLGTDIFTFYDDFNNKYTSEDDWNLKVADINYNTLIIKQNGEAETKINFPADNYDIEFYIKEIYNNTLEVYCGNSTVKLGVASKIGSYKFTGYCPAGKLKLKATNSEDPEAKVIIDTIFVKKAGNFEFSASYFENQYYPTDPVVKIDGILEEILARVYNPNVKNYDFPFSLDNIAWLKNILKLSKNGSFYIKDLNGNTINYCFEQQNGECNQTPTNKRIWLKMNFDSHAPWIRFIAYRYDGKPAGLVDGKDIFDFYDDFNDNDPLKRNGDLIWQEYGSVGSYDEENGAIELYNNWGDPNKFLHHLDTVNTFLPNIKVDLRFKQDAYTKGPAIIFGDNILQVLFAPDTLGGLQLRILDKNKNIDKINSTTYNYAEASLIISNDSVDIYRSWANILNNISTSITTFGKIGIAGDTDTSDKRDYIDWIRIHKYNKYFVTPFVNFELINYDNYNVSCVAYKFAYDGDKPLKNYVFNLTVPSVLYPYSNYILITFDGKYINYCLYNSTNCLPYGVKNPNGLLIKYPIIYPNDIDYDPDGISSSNKFIIYKIQSPNGIKQYGNYKKVIGEVNTTLERKPVLEDLKSTAKISCKDYILRTDISTACVNEGVLSYDGVSVTTYKCLIDPDGIGPEPLENVACYSQVVLKSCDEYKENNLLDTLCALNQTYSDFALKMYYCPIDKDGPLGPSPLEFATCYNQDIKSSCKEYITSGTITSMCNLFADYGYTKIYLCPIDPDGEGLNSVEFQFCGYPYPIYRTCLKWLKSGLYTSYCDVIDEDKGYYNCMIDPDGPEGGIEPFKATCDMKTDGGGWTLVLNYLHKGGTNPSLNILIDHLPTIGSTTLGVDESKTEHWGHASNSLLKLISQYSNKEYRFFCKSSYSSKIIHFISNDPSVDSYFTTGSGHINIESFRTSYKPLPDHNADLPQASEEGFLNMGDHAMTNNPFYKNTYYFWSIRGSSSIYDKEDDWWMCNDIPYSYFLYSEDTYHQIWIR